MKKLIVLCLAGLLILAFSSAYAQEKLEFKASGFLDAQSFWYVNVTPGNPAAGFYHVLDNNYRYGQPAFDRKVAYLESRTRLRFDAIMGKSLSGTILFEMDAGRWGGPTGDRNSYGFWAGDRASVEIKNIYIDFGVPAVPVPISMRVGLQPLSIRNHLLVYTDGMGITAGIKIDPITIQPIWFKAVEGRDWTADDVDVYGLNLSAKIGTFTVGGYGLYYNMNSYPFWATATATGTFQAEMWWLGLYADGKAGPVDVNFDFIYDRGKVERPGVSVLPPILNFPDVKYRGWVTRLKIDFPWEKFNFGAVGMYASGADANKTSTTGLPGSATANGAITSKVNSFAVPPGSETGAIFGESVVFYSSWINRGDSGIGDSLNYNQMCRGGVGGTWMAKAYASVKATPWYKLTFQALYIGDTTKNGNTVGNASASPFVYILRDDKDIGWEFDLIHEIQIYKNLKYTIGMGYLFAGKALDRGVAGLFPFPFTNVAPHDPWQITTNLTYNF